MPVKKESPVFIPSRDAQARAVTASEYMKMKGIGRVALWKRRKNGTAPPCFFHPQTRKLMVIVGESEK